MKKNYPIVILLLVASIVFIPAINAMAEQVQPAPKDSGVSAYELIASMNSLRESYGYSALVEDATVDAVAQATADTMAAEELSWHIGNASGRLEAAGYGGGKSVNATENFAVGTNLSLDDIMTIWSDSEHMLPATTPYYCNIGAGVATAANGMTYYVLQAAYVSGQTCGSITHSTSVATSASTPSNDATKIALETAYPVSQVVYPVVTATPDSNGKVYHVVKSGQSFWSIAIAYNVTIADIRKWNNLSSTYQLQIGDKLFIPNSNTAGYATPTSVDFVATSTPEADGKIVHVVQAYQTLSSIAEAYNISVDTITSLNSISTDAVLQIGEKLVVRASQITPSPTPKPLTPLQKLTPDSDGKYYHKVTSGESLSYIANLYSINVTDLESWNGLSESSMLQIGEKLLLKVTPPATVTATAMPATATPTRTPVTPTSSPTVSPTPFSSTPTTVAETPSLDSNSALYVVLGFAVVIFGLSLAAWFYHKSGKRLVILGKRIF